MSSELRTPFPQPLERMLRVDSSNLTVDREIASAMSWMDAHDGRRLRIELLIRSGLPLTKLQHFLRGLDAGVAAHRDRPLVRAYLVGDEPTNHMLGELADLDTRAPRIEVVRVLNATSDPSWLTQLAREAATAESSMLLFWPYIRVRRPRELAILADRLVPHTPGQAGACFRRFPVVELPGRLALEDALPIARFWRRHPDTQASSVRSLGGRIATFFRLYESARLTRLGLDPSSISLPVDTSVLTGFSAAIEPSGVLRDEPRTTSAVLEHDVDLLSDSHECQSPVFAFASTPSSARRGQPRRNAP